MLPCLFVIFSNSACRLHIRSWWSGLYSSTEFVRQKSLEKCFAMQLAFYYVTSMVKHSIRSTVFLQKFARLNNDTHEIYDVVGRATKFHLCWTSKSSVQAAPRWSPTNSQLELVATLTGKRFADLINATVFAFFRHFSHKLALGWFKLFVSICSGCFIVILSLHT